MRAPKPKSSVIKDGAKYHVFDATELANFLEETQESSLGIEDKNGNVQAVIPVRVLRRLLAPHDPVDKTCR